ncbi:hypothetical protein [Aquamicrobium sp. LC103]|uniref:hypothetical protein n=1 Tax=Aquamicrobium sp. LC103 TaxID=1120658 RepID=UPI00063E9ED3|nr:hypothetical protein [Aquamicrobium sp. LC103]TKT80290.1 hypothetical protein XW59_008065 [Aquamicrobium sp. LC103]
MALLISALRALAIAAVFSLSIAMALAISLGLAHAGYLGSCQDGACELAAVIYVTPFLGTGLYFASLIGYSIYCRRSTREPRP